MSWFTTKIIVGSSFLGIFFCPLISHGGEPSQKTGLHSEEIASNGLPGLVNVGLLPLGNPSVLGAAGLGYGVIESMGPVSGTHHSLRGKIAVGAIPLTWMGLGVVFDGKIDLHPEDDNGADKSIIGNPYFTWRLGKTVVPGLALGGELRVWVPGGDAPSFHWNATTVDFTAIGTINPKSKLTMGLKLGFRLDNSASAAPDLNETRVGDIISLGLSDYNGILTGVGVVYRLSRVSLLFEFSGDFLVGKKAPTSKSPFRLNGGIRHQVFRSLQLELMTQTSLSGRPSISPSEPLVPIEPRFAVTLGVAYRRGVDHHSTQPVVFESDPPIQVLSQIESQQGQITGQIVDMTGEPVPNAEVMIVVGDAQITTQSDLDGRFVVEGIPWGQGVMKINAPYFEPVEQVIDVRGGIVELPVQQLIDQKIGSQIRGLVRSFAGKGLSAQITVAPGNHVVQTEPSGNFVVDVEPGSYTVEIRSKGFHPQRRTVQVSENSVTVLNVDLHKQDN